ncbi:crosslink repair DNA glycosylase YcaQ family protein, partial [Streptomyces albidoflavus]|uniref:winged helix DNA-binding domain-containing protein n=1 Tax=Streptomyces albidoflavus TaxID=1886 RepID=UPI0033BA942E
MTVLSHRALNRATLARQLLLDRSGLGPLDAVAHLGGLQAQEPQEPYLGLHARLRAFDPAELSALLVDRQVVRTHLMRRTVHLVTADDALAWRGRHEAMLRQRVLGVYRAELAGVDLEELAEAGRQVMADGRPRTMAEVAAELAGRWHGPGKRALGEMVVAALIPMVQLPPRGLWRQKAGVRNLPLAAWLGRDIVPPPAAGGPDPAGEALVRRYLAAYSPAASADLRAWCGLGEVHSVVVHEPVGVCGLITPWNYPLLQASWKV